MQGWPLLPRSIDDLVHLLQRPADALEGKVELIVRRVELVDDRLKGRIGVDVISDAEEQAVGNVHEDRHFVQVVPDD
jgi:hypothetical protein